MTLTLAQRAKLTEELDRLNLGPMRRSAFLDKYRDTIKVTKKGNISVGGLSISDRLAADDYDHRIAQADEKAIELTPLYREAVRTAIKKALGSGANSPTVEGLLKFYSNKCVVSKVALEQDRIDGSTVIIQGVPLADRVRQDAETLPRVTSLDAALWDAFTPEERKGPEFKTAEEAFQAWCDEREGDPELA